MGIVAGTPAPVKAPDSSTSLYTQHLFLVVNNQACSSPEIFCTIQAAIDAAVPGSTVFVRSGLYRENIVINKNIILAGDADKPVIDPEWGDTIQVTHADLHLKGFILRGLNTAFVVSGGKQQLITIEDVIFQTDMMGDGDGIELRAGLQHQLTLGKDVLFEIPGTALELSAGIEHKIEIQEGVIFQTPHEAIVIHGGSKHLINLHAGVNFLMPETALLISGGSGHVIDARAVRIQQGYMDVRGGGSNIILGYEHR